mmetsp:Transcript_451/g.905  ORF Transcript_451/g.905 Transcript_451/m.905 type:complete len:312 (+) Transcript_451:114-1049(+)
MNDQRKDEESASVDAVLSDESNKGNTRNRHALVDDKSTRSSDSSESNSSSSSSSPSNSPPPSPISTPKRHNKSNHFQLSTDAMTGDQIRQNAWELLQANPSDIRANSPPPKQYQTYHDAPTISSMHRTNQFQNDSFHNSGGIANNPNANSGYYETSGDLSFQNVASMALSCMAHCLTEGYRAAATYYTGESTQHSSMRSNGNYHQNYNYSGSYYSDNYNDESRGNNSTNWESDGGNNNVNISGYSGSYQNKETAKQTTLSQSTITKEVEENSKQKVLAAKEPAQPTSTEPQGEYTSVAMPATYQGGSKIMG